MIKDRPINDAQKMLPLTPSNHQINNPQKSYRAHSRMNKTFSPNRQLKCSYQKCVDGIFHIVRQFYSSKYLYLHKVMRTKEKVSDEMKLYTLIAVARLPVAGCRIRLFESHRQMHHEPHNFIHERECEMKEQKTFVNGSDDDNDLIIYTVRSRDRERETKHQ